MLVIMAIFAVVGLVVVERSLETIMKCYTVVRDDK